MHDDSTTASLERLHPPPTKPPPQAAPCPGCGHRPTPYKVQLSALLDMVLLLEAVLHDVKHQVEEMAS